MPPPNPSIKQALSRMWYYFVSIAAVSARREV